MNVGPRSAWTPDFGPELFGRGVAGGEGRQPRRVRHERGRVGLHDLRDAEVQDLHHGAANRLRQKQVRRLQIAMYDAHPVGQRHGLGDRAHQHQRFLLGKRPAHGFQSGVQAHAVEPFEDEVRDLRAGGDAQVQHPNDARVLVEHGQDAALVVKALEKLLTGISPYERGHEQALDSNRVKQVGVGGSVDNAKAPFAGDGVIRYLPSRMRPTRRNLSSLSCMPARRLRLRPGQPGGFSCHARVGDDGGSGRAARVGAKTQGGPFPTFALARPCAASRSFFSSRPSTLWCRP